MGLMMNEKTQNATSRRHMAPSLPAMAALLLIASQAGLAQQSAPTSPAPATASAVSQDSQSPASTAPGADGQIKPKGLTLIDSSTYIIGAEDGLQITVWKEPTLSGTFPVRPDGMISLVLVGDVVAAGLTPIELGANITTKLKKFIQDPSVSVVVTAVNSKRIFMIGEVGKVGPLSLSPGMTPLQAIASAGGLSTFANAKRIYILRGEPGKQQKIPFNYKQALKGDNKQSIALLPGDTIVVP